MSACSTRHYHRPLTLLLAVGACISTLPSAMMRRPSSPTSHVFAGQSFTPHPIQSGFGHIHDTGVDILFYLISLFPYLFHFTFQHHSRFHFRSHSLLYPLILCRSSRSKSYDSRVLNLRKRIPLHGVWRLVRPLRRLLTHPYSLLVFEGELFAWQSTFWIWSFA